MSQKPTLLIMAAGMASRFGGAKQIEPVGQNGEIIMDYSIYDARRAGFEDVIIIIKKDMQEQFDRAIGKKLAKYVNLRYAYQDMNDIPAGFTVPEGRVKPWGTGHAVLSARALLKGPVAVINADDYYGTEAFEKMYKFLAGLDVNNSADQYGICMWQLNKTLSDNGSVSRGVCILNAEGKLEDIMELKKIEKDGQNGKYTLDDGKTYKKLAGDMPVSMNFLGFGAGFVKDLERGFTEFLQNELIKNPLKAEFLLPEFIAAAMKAGKVSVSTMKSSDRWFGVTYRDDKAVVVASLKELNAKGIYPTPLWQ